MTRSRRRMARPGRHRGVSLTRVRRAIRKRRRAVNTTTWMRSLGLGLLALLGAACGSSGTEPPGKYHEGLRIQVDAASIEGSFGQNGGFVEFIGNSDLQTRGAMS